MHGCTDRVSRPVTVYPQPRADFTASPTHQVYPSATVTLLNESNPGYWEFLWETGDGSTLNGGEPRALHI
jgi:PKD repeat protein